MGHPVRSAIVWALTQSLPVCLVALLAGGLAFLRRRCQGSGAQFRGGSRPGRKRRCRQGRQEADGAATDGILRARPLPGNRRLREGIRLRAAALRGLRNARKGRQVIAVLEIPELQLQVRQDDAAIRNATDQATLAEHELGRVEAQHKVLHLQAERLSGVAKTNPGMVAQQEVDDAQGKDLAAEAQIEASKSNLQGAQSQLAQAQAKREHDQVLFDTEDRRLSPAS